MFIIVEKSTLGGNRQIARHFESRTSANSITPAQAIGITHPHTSAWDFSLNRRMGLFLKGSPIRQTQRSIPFKRLKINYKISSIHLNRSFHFAEKPFTGF